MFNYKALALVEHNLSVINKFDNHYGMVDLENIVRYSATKNIFFIKERRGLGLSRDLSFTTDYFCCPSLGRKIALEVWHSPDDFEQKIKFYIKEVPVNDWSLIKTSLSIQYLVKKTDSLANFSFTEEYFKENLLFLEKISQFKENKNIAKLLIVAIIDLLAVPN